MAHDDVQPVLNALLKEVDAVVELFEEYRKVVSPYVSRMCTVAVLRESAQDVAKIVADYLELVSPGNVGLAVELFRADVARWFREWADVSLGAVPGDVRSVVRANINDRFA